MNYDDSFLYFMYGRIRRAQYGEWRNLTYRKARAEYRRRLGYNKQSRTCTMCKRVINNKRMITIDHIIPLWVCREYDMPNLEFDLRNFRMACKECNGTRGKLMTIESLDLPDKVKKRLIGIRDSRIKP